MFRTIVLIFVGVLLAGCVGLPTLTPTATAPAASQPAYTATPELPLVTIIGNVYLRDADDEVQGWLPLGGAVRARCDREWCYLENGLRFWRGCSSDNPNGLACRKEG